MTEYIERAMMGRPDAWTTWGAFRDEVPFLDWTPLLIVVAVFWAALG